MAVAQVLSDYAESCDHEWERCLTPPDSLSDWYRCKSCGAFGYRKTHRWGASKKARIVPYVCQVKGCSEIAVDRLPGRGHRMAYLWRCRKCMTEKSEDPSK